MKKKVLISIMLCSILLFGCAPQKAPSRVGTRTSSASVSFPYNNMKDYINEVDILAEIEITKQLGETDYGVGATYFEASIMKVYENKTTHDTKTIRFYQDGYSKNTLKGYPLFAVGDRLLLGLKDSNQKLKDSNPPQEAVNAFKDYFYIVGSYAGSIQIQFENDNEFMLTYVPTRIKEIQNLSIISNKTNISELNSIERHLTQSLNLEEGVSLQPGDAYRDIKDRTVVNAQKLRQIIETIS